MKKGFYCPASPYQILWCLATVYDQLFLTWCQSVFFYSRRLNDEKRKIKDVTQIENILCPFGDYTASRSNFSALNSSESVRVESQTLLTGHHPRNQARDNQPELEWIVTFVSNTWRKSVTFSDQPSPRVKFFSKKVVVSVLSFFIVNWIKLWSKKEEMNLCLFSTQQLISASPMAGRSFRINAFWVDVRRLLTLGHLRRERLKRLDGRPSLWN